MIERLQTFFVVTLLAVLIWLYAEAQNPATPERREITIRLIAPPNSNLRVQMESSTKINIDLVGSTAAVTSINDKLSREPLQFVLGEFGLPVDPGSYSEPLLELLRRHPIFDDAKVRLLEVDPTVIRFSVNRIVERVLEVQSASFGDIETEGGVSIRPPSVTARIPENLLRDVDEGSLRALATPRFDPGQQYRPGEQYTVDGVLTVPGIADQSAVELSRDWVRMTFTVRSTRMETIVKNVPIQIVIPPLDQNRFDITLSDVLIPELHLAGPSHLIEQINQRELRITGQAVFSSDELTRQITEKTVTFNHLPDSLDILSDPVTVGVTIRRRDESSQQ